VPSNWLRNLIHQIVTTTQFELIIAAFIVLNVIVMACETSKQGQAQQALLSVADVLFNLCFAGEVVLKLIALHPLFYFKSNWNKFDFAVVMVSFFGIAFDMQGASLAVNPTILRVLRIFRLFRLLRAFRIFKAAEGLQRLVRTLMRSLGAVGNLGALLLLLFFIIGVLSVEMFGNLCVEDEVEMSTGGLVDRCRLVAEDQRITKHANFRDIGMAFLTLFRISTGDNWSEIMQSCSLQPGLRPFEDSLQRAKLFLQEYQVSHDPLLLDFAMQELPVCQTEEELLELRGLVSCVYPDSFGRCPSTCGIKELSNLLFSAFLCASNFILLNLVMAVLMQELQAAIVAPSEKVRTDGVVALMQINKATNILTSKLDGDKAGSPLGKQSSSNTLNSDASARGRVAGSADGSARRRKASVVAQNSIPLDDDYGAISSPRSDSPLRRAKRAGGSNSKLQKQDSNRTAASMDEVVSKTAVTALVKSGSSGSARMTKRVSISELVKN